MSYDIYIGEKSTDERGRPCRVRPHAEPAAPQFEGDGMTRNENHRHPGYSAWAGWV